MSQNNTKHVLVILIIFKEIACQTDCALHFLSVFLSLSLQNFVISGVSAWPEDTTSRESAATSETGVWDSQ